MRIKSRAVAGLVAGCALVAVSAAPASAAPKTVTSDAGTTCTVDSDARVGAGLVIRPITFSGSISCSPADPAKVPSISTTGLTLTGKTPIGLIEAPPASGSPNQPGATRPTPLPPPGSEGAGGYDCVVKPDVDCGASGTTTGLPLATYQAIFFTTIIAPAGETWTASDGCDLQGVNAQCASSSNTVATT